MWNSTVWSFTSSSLIVNSIQQKIQRYFPLLLTHSEWRASLLSFSFLLSPLSVSISPSCCPSLCPSILSPSALSPFLCCVSPSLSTVPYVSLIFSLSLSILSSSSLLLSLYHYFRDGERDIEGERQWEGSKREMESERNIQEREKRVPSSQTSSSRHSQQGVTETCYLMDSVLGFELIRYM